MRFSAILLALLLLAVSFAPATAEPLDLTQFARITATGTQPTFLLLWPRETDDAPYTVRDGDLATGWKIPREGAHTLMLDFAPLLTRAPLIGSLSAEWKTQPESEVCIRVSTHCGGWVLEESTWSDPTLPYELTSPQQAFCVELTVEDAGPANLLELHVYGEANDEEHKLKNLAVTAIETGLRLNWELVGWRPNHVEIHYVDSPDAPLSTATLIDYAKAEGPWEGPRPAASSRYTVVVPVASDGATGEAVSIELPDRDKPLLQTSGIVEGFYGRPWSHLERRLVINFLARANLGLYIYGPKNDPLHRDEWREPYDDQAIAQFAELRQLADQLGVTMSFGISPGKDMVMDDPTEQATLLAKLQPFVEVGFRHFTLLLDDIENDIATPVDSSLAQRHVTLANWLLDELNDMAGEPVALWVVPTVYSTERQYRWEGGTEYLAEYAALDSAIEVMWTGIDTFSKTLSAADLDEVAGLIGRPPAIWDNEHGTDGGDGFTGKVYLAPYLNRSADLVEAVAGIVTNPMILGGANRLMLGTYTAYLENPNAYDPDAASIPAARMNGLNEYDQNLAQFMTQVFYGNGALGMPGVAFPHYRQLEEAIGAMLAVVPNGSFAEIREAAVSLAHIGGRMATMQNDLHHGGLDVSTVDDLWFPANRFPLEGRAVLYLLDWVGSCLAGQEDAAALAKADTLLFDAFFNRYETSLMQVNRLRRQLGKNPLGEGEFTAPVVSDPPSDWLFAGEPWQYSPTTDGAVSIAVFGLPGSTVSKGAIDWTPPHAGIYQAVIVADSAQGWAWKELTLIVGPSADTPLPDDDDASEDDQIDDDTIDDDVNDDDQSGDDDDNDDGCGC